MATYVIYSNTNDGYLASWSTSYESARAGSNVYRGGSDILAGQQLSGSDYLSYEGLAAFTVPDIGVGAFDPVSVVLSLYVSNANSSGSAVVLEARSAVTFGTAAIETTQWVPNASIEARPLFATYERSALANSTWATATGTTRFSDAVRTAGTVCVLITTNTQRLGTAPVAGTAEYVTIAPRENGTTTAPKLTITTGAFLTGWHLFVGGQDLVTSSDITALSVSDSGPNTVGTLRARLANPDGTLVLQPGADVALYHGDTQTVVFQGPIVSRSYTPAYADATDIEIEAADRSAWLDRAFVLTETIVDGSNDRQAVQQLVNDYGTTYNLSAPTSTVAWTKDGIYDLVIDAKTLRQALQLVADASIGVDPSGVEWSARTVPVEQYTGVAFGTSVLRWAGVAQDGTAVYSADSYTWSTATGTVYAASLIHANDVFVAGGGGSAAAAGTGARVYWSTTGTAWSSATLGTGSLYPYATLVAQASAVAYYRLNDTTGTVATATIGTAGTYVGSPTLSAAGALADDTGNTGVGFTNIGSPSRYASIPLPNASGTAWTIEAWAKRGGLSATQYATFAYVGNFGTDGYGFGMSNGAGGAGSAFTVFYGNTYWTPGYNIGDTNYHHFAVTRVNGTAVAYVDGTACPTSSTAVPTTPTSTAGIAGAGTAWTMLYNGNLDEVAFYPTGLSAATIADHYTSGTATKHGPLRWGQAAYGTAGWVIAGGDSTTGYVGKSATGTASWSVTNTLAGTPLYGVAYGGGSYVAVGGTSILYSANGTAWSTATSSPAVGTALRAVASNGSAFVAVGDGGAIYFGTAAAGTYVKQTAPSTANLTAVTWWPQGSLWVAVGAANTTFTSYNGTSWVDQITTTFAPLSGVGALGTASHILAAGSGTILGSLVIDTTPRQFYVDQYGQINYDVSGWTKSPYDISDAPNNINTIAAGDLEIEFDESGIVNRVFVASAASNWLYGAWVEDDNSIATYGQRDGFLVNELVVDAATAERFGRAYLATRKDAVVRGSFTVVNKNGWKAGQVVRITNAAFGLSQVSYLITQVDTEFLTGTGVRQYRVSFGGLPKSLVRVLAAGE